MNCRRRLGALAAAAFLALGLVTFAFADSSDQVMLGEGEGYSGVRITDGPRPSRRGLHGKFLHITDFHPDEYYKPLTSEKKGCHRGKGDAGVYGAELSGCDSSLSLVNATFDWIAENLKDEVDFVIWTGDSARHDNDESIPRTATEVLRTNQYLVDRMKMIFADDRNPSQLAVPIVPNIGNNDFLPHNILHPGPNKWLRYYADMWRPFIPEEQRHVFEFGGWYSVEVIPNQLSVFSLNTMYFFDRNAGIDDCVTPSEPGFKQMEWLRIQLQQLRERGMKAILIGHVPPAKTASKKLWDETCWQKYNLWLRQYRDVVVGSAYGHMNIDHFLLQDTKDINIRLLGGVEGDYGLEYYDNNEEDTGLELYEDEQEMEDSIIISGKAKYLRDLRRTWARLPEVTPLCEESRESSTDFELSRGKKKGRKGKKRRRAEKNLGGKWAERYHISFVGASVIPNFLPSMRVVEYNITGLEDAETWSPSEVPETPVLLNDDEMAELESEMQQARALKNANKGKKGKKKKGKKGKKGKKDPNLVVPHPPDKDSLPGPAYAPQPLTWLGYTQYFANITRINEQAASGEGGEGGEFQYEIEYDTFSDRMYKLEDLTVRNYVKLAYRMGLAMKKKGKKNSLADLWDEFDGLSEWGEGIEEEDEELDLERSEDEQEGEVDASDTDRIECQVLDVGKNKKRKRKSNEAWRRFVKYAFVSTGFEEDALAESGDVEGGVEGQGETDEWGEL
ncbi:hypothetical protein VUR80DRAFT_7131 [Thermomyces stellatus]